MDVEVRLLSLRRSFLLLLWFVGLVFCWKATTSHFLEGKGRDYSQQVQGEIYQQEKISEIFASLRRAFSVYVKEYSYQEQDLSLNYISFLEEARHVLLSIRLQHTNLKSFQNQLPVLNPLYHMEGKRILKILPPLLSSFGKRRDPFLGQWGFHTGVDLEANGGDPVYATGDGIVLPSSKNPDYGRNVILQHAYGFRTLYAHLSKIFPGVVAGKQITHGEILGFVGKTGRATGFHLHYEIQNQDTLLDPSRYLDWGKSLP